MEKRIIIITDYDYINNDVRITRSEHYCVEFGKTNDDNHTLFDKAVKLLNISKEKVWEWWVE